MEYRKEKNSYYIRLDKDENLIESIRQLCQNENIQAGYFQGIGACDHVVLGTYIPEKQDYTLHTLSGMLEMVSLTGNITIAADNKPFLHSHGIFSYLDENGNLKLTGGHLREARISYTGEIILNTADKAIGRMFDQKAGIEVWKLSK